MTTDQITEPDRLTSLADMADAAWQSVRSGGFGAPMLQATKALRDMDGKRQELKVYLRECQDSIRRAYAEAVEFDEAATARKAAVKAVAERKAAEPICVTGKPLAHDQYIVEELTRFLCRMRGDEYVTSGHVEKASTEGTRLACRNFLAELDRKLIERATGPCVWIGGTYDAPTICDEPRTDLGRRLVCAGHEAAYAAGETPLPFSRESVIFLLDAERDGRCAADPAAGYEGTCDDGPAEFRVVVTSPDGDPSRTPGRLCRYHADQEMARIDEFPTAYPHHIAQEPYAETGK